MWLLESPGHARNPDEVSRLLTGERLHATAADAETTRLIADDGRSVALTFAARGLADLGPRFWVLFLAGYAAHLMALFAIGLGPALWPGLLLWVATTGFFAAISAHAWHSDPTWAMPLWQWNFALAAIVIGSTLSVWAIVALLLLAPRRIAKVRLAFTCCVVAELVDVTASWAHGSAAPHRWVLVAGLLGLGGLCALQWRRWQSVVSLPMAVQPS